MRWHSSGRSAPVCKPPTLGSFLAVRNGVPAPLRRLSPNNAIPYPMGTMSQKIQPTHANLKTAQFSPAEAHRGADQGYLESGCETGGP